MLLIGLAYLLLAYGLWGQRNWTRKFSFYTLAFVVLASVLKTMNDKILELDFVLVFFLCCVVNFVIAAWFFLGSKENEQQT